jgi:hypothetical protein
MSRKVYVTLTVKAVILADDDADVQNVIDELDYSFTDTTGKAEVLDTTIEDYEITDSK